MKGIETLLNKIYTGQQKVSALAQPLARITEKYPQVDDTAKRFYSALSRLSGMSSANGVGGFRDLHSPAAAIRRKAVSEYLNLLNQVRQTGLRRVSMEAGQYGDPLSIGSRLLMLRKISAILPTPAKLMKGILVPGQYLDDAAKSGWKTIFNRTSPDEKNYILNLIKMAKGKADVGQAGARHAAITLNKNVADLVKRFGAADQVAARAGSHTKYLNTPIKSVVDKGRAWANHVNTVAGGGRYVL